MKKMILISMIALCSSQAFAGRLIDKIQERRQEKLENQIQLDESNGIVGELPITKNTLLNLAYGSSKGEMLDVYFPSVTSNKKIILMVHGGAWKIGDKRHSPVITNKVKYFGSKGYTLVSINYDLVPHVTVEQQMLEVAQALNYVQQNAQNWNADGNKVILMGHSAGAHLVSLLSTSVYLKSVKYPILGTVSLDSAAYNIPIIMQKPKHYGFYDDVFGNNQQYWKEMSPYYQINEKIKPMYLVCSTLRDDSCDQAEAFSSKAQTFGNTVYIDKETKKHEEINEQLGSDLIYTQKVESFINSLN